MEKVVKNDASLDSSKRDLTPQERRALSNRIAQREWRKRQAHLAKMAGSGPNASKTAEPYHKQGQSIIRLTRQDATANGVNGINSTGHSTGRGNGRGIISTRNNSHVDKSMTTATVLPRNSSSAWCHNSARTISLTLRADYDLIRVVQNNLVKGFISNMEPLRLSPAEVSIDTAISSFVQLPAAHWQGGYGGGGGDGGALPPGADANTTNNTPSTPPRLLLPPTLAPTTLQLTVPHHPWIDLLPCATLRDNVIRAGEAGQLSDAQESDLCGDMMGFGQLQLDGMGPGLLLWGEPFHLESWEVSEAMLRKWAPIFHQCQLLLRASTRRRRQRGF